MLSLLRFLFLGLIVVTAIFPAGCDYAKNQLKADRTGNMEVQDYKDALAPRLPEVDDKAAEKDYAAIPGLQPYVASNVDSIASMPLVSIKVNQTVPLREVLYELAEQADYDIELDPRIDGAIIFTARNRPFDEVIDRISDIAGLRYKFEGQTLRVELDMPLNKTYKIDYLNLVRTNSSSINYDISVVSGDGTDTGSSYETNFTSENDFWTGLDASIQQILASANTNIMRTMATPQVTVAEPNPQVAPVASPDGSVNVQPPEVNLNVGALPVGDGSDSGAESPELSYSINRQAGLIQVFAPDRTHKKINQYLNDIKKIITSQVLIEAKILEVTLSDSYQTGIEWSEFGILNGKFDLQYSIPNSAAIDPTVDPRLYFAYTGSNDFSSAIEALSTFGTVKALASPRLTVLNNQSAVLNVATNRVFFELSVDSTLTEDGRDTTVTSSIRNVPEGVLVNVQPSINLDTGTISMAVRPTITRIDTWVKDPGVAFVVAEADLDGIESKIPELNVQEVDSIINVKSGEAVVMGGLLQDRVSVTDEGVPGLSEIPMVGNLFKRHEDTVTKTELVLFLKATILEQPGDSVHNTDKDLYRRFSDDRRPFKL